jgi:PAS domain S-box-containing protein
MTAEPLAPDFALRQAEILQLIASARPLNEVLDRLVSLIEELSDGVFGSILVVDEEGRRLRDGAGPSLPPEYRRAIDGLEIGPGAGSCGSAAFLGQPVAVRDIATDPNWDAYRHLALAHGLRSCWSSPILSSQGAVLGTFAMYALEPREPSERDRALVNEAGRLAAIAIERERDQRARDALLREQAAREASEGERARLQNIFRQAPAAVAVLRGPEHVFEIVNARYELASGRSAEQLLGKPAREALPEVEGQGFFELLDSVYRTGEPFVGNEMPLQLDLRGTGELETRYFTFIYQPLHGAEEEVDGIFAHAVDVTDHVRSRQTVKTITDNAGSGLFMMDERGYPVFMNPAAETITGYRLDEIRARPLHDSIHFLYADGRPYPMSECPIDIAAADLVPIRDHEDVFVRKDGTFYHVRGNVAPIEQDGRTIGAVLDFRDVTAEKEAEEQLRRASAIKDEFLGLVSHEMRTPLTTVLGFARMLARRGEEMAPERRGPVVHEIVTGAERLHDIVENMLMLTRLDRTNLEVEPVDIEPLLEELVHEHRARHPSRPVRLDVEPGIPLVLASAVLVRQVVLNLLSNAEKYSPGTSEVAVEARREHTSVVVRVLDRGEGIDPAEAEAIFELFYRSARAKQRPGIGLGLAVCKRLVEALGGSIWATSRPTHGSEVGFRLPLSQPGP